MSFSEFYKVEQSGWYTCGRGVSARVLDVAGVVPAAAAAAAAGGAAPGAPVPPRGALPRPARRRVSTLSSA